MTDWDGFPPTLRVGPHDYTIKIVANWGGEDNAYGQFVPDKLAFMFNEESVAKSSAIDTSLHEIVHALLAPLQLKDSKEELICLTLGPGLTQVFRDNPQYLKWLSDLGNDKNGNTTDNASSEYRGYSGCACDDLGKRCACGRKAGRA